MFRLSSVVAGLRAKRHIAAHRKSAGVRLTAGAAAFTALVGMSVWVAVGEGSASGAAAAGSLAKTGTDITTGRTDTVNGGDTVRYVLSATNDTSSPANVDIADTFGPGQTLAPNSVQAPPGYAVDTSSGVKVSGTAVPGSKGQSVAVTPSFGSVKTTVSHGDGFQAIFFNDRVYNVHHHTSVSDRMIDCHVQASGDPCPRVGGGTWPSGGLSALQASGTGLVADPTPTTYHTANAVFVYQAADGKLYLPVAIDLSKDTGLACVDLVSETSCGFTKVYTAQNDATPLAGYSIAGGATVGTNFYLMGDTGQVFCMNMAASPISQCAGAWPVQAISPTPAANAYNGSAGQIRTFDGRHLYLTYPGALPGCLDATTGQVCASFKPAPASPPAGVQLVPLLDASGAQTGICVADQPAAYGGRCWDASGAPATDPFPSSTTVAGEPTQQWGWSKAGTPAVIGTRVYYTALLNDLQGMPAGESYVCHDFTEAPGTICSGFNAQPVDWRNGQLRAYTLTQNPQLSNCIWEIGDAGVIDVFDARTGADAFAGQSVPACVPPKVKAAVTVQPAKFYCDGSSSHWTTYDQLALTGVAQGATFSGTVTLSDGATVLDTVNVSQASFPLDLGKYTSPSLTATLDVSANQWPATGTALQLTFKGDAPQVCFNVKVADNCDKSIASLDDTATLTVDGVQAAVQKYSFAPFNSAGTCPVPHLVYKKTASKTSTKPGEDLTYTIDVKNDGTGPTIASFTDNLTDILKNATFKSASVGTVANNILTWSGALAPNQHADITITVTVNASARAGTGLPNTVVDTTPGVDSNCKSGSQDANCSVTPTVGGAPNLRYVKTSTVTSAKPGDTVPYTITVTNTGNTTISSASFTDDLATMKPNASIVGSSAAASSGAASVSGDVLSWSGRLAPGDSARITYNVVIASSAPSGAKLPNTVVDTTSGVDTNCEQGSLATACFWTVKVGSAPQLKYTKVSSAPSAKPGDTVTYTITVQNTGNVSTDAAFTDDLSNTLRYADLVANSVTASPGTTAKVVGSTLSWSGTLNQGASATVTYKVTVHSDAAGGQSWRNTVIDTTPPTTPSNCKQNVTQPDCTVTVSVGQAPELQYEKTASTSSPRPGETVDYKIHVTNVGNVVIPQVSFHDSLADVLANATLVTSSVKPAAASVSPQNVLTWSGPLARGASVDITYEVTVKPGVAAGAQLHNVVVDDTANVTSNCKAASTDPNCPVTIAVAPAPSLSFAKTADVTTAKPGDTVTYSVVVTNTGNSTIAEASLSDDLTTVLQHASFTSVVAPATGAAFNPSTRVLTWKGSLTAGHSVTVKYAIKIAADAPAGFVLRNGVVNSTPSVPSNCDPKSADPKCQSSPVVAPTPHLVFVKTANVSSARPGDLVTYTITVTNTGNSTIDPASFTDDLSAVLSQTSLVGTSVRASAGTAAVTAGRLIWSNALKQGESATVTYTVKVKANAAAAQGLRNVVVNATPTTPSDCDAGSPDAKCAVTVTLPVPPSSGVLPVVLGHTPAPAPNAIDTGLGANRHSSGLGLLPVTLGTLLVLAGAGVLLLAVRRRRPSA